MRFININSVQNGFLQFDDNIDNHTLLKLTKPARVEKICLQNQLEQNEEISIVQSLRTQIGIRC